MMAVQETSDFCANRVDPRDAPKAYFESTTMEQTTYHTCAQWDANVHVSQKRCVCLRINGHRKPVGTTK